MRFKVTGTTKVPLSPLHQDATPGAVLSKVITYAMREKTGEWKVLEYEDVIYRVKRDSKEQPSLLIFVGAEKKSQKPHRGRQDRVPRKLEGRPNSK